jgi:2-(1,2-epoxy-1,2-dihydrophenyl)acetyl-CoA isomerase
VIQVHDDGAVRTLTLARPEARNALDLAILRSLRTALVEAADPAIRCLVLTGAGKAFSAGADLVEWSAAEASGALATYPWTREYHALVAALAAFAKPTVAVLNGAAVGAGLDLALACDFRLAADTARFQCAYTRMGYAPDGGGTWLLPRLVGAAWAKRFVFTGEFWSAAEALERGLISALYPAEGLAEAGAGFARRLAAGPTVALMQAKQLIDGAHRRTLPEQLAAEARAAEICGASADAKEAMAAAMARREPVFGGR